MLWHFARTLSPGSAPTKSGFAPERRSADAPSATCHAGLTRSFSTCGRHCFQERAHATQNLLADAQHRLTQAEAQRSALQARNRKCSSRSLFTNSSSLSQMPPMHNHRAALQVYWRTSSLLKQDQQSVPHTLSPLHLR